LAQERGLGQRVIELSIVQALAFNALGENRRAMEAVRQALAAGEPEGHVCIYRQGPEFEGLLAEAAARGIATGFARRLRGLAGVEEPPIDENPPAGRVETPPAFLVVPTPEGELLVEPLSERELEVLRMVAEGLTNSQIASKLYIELGTIKRHINHIFGKLGVTTRTLAVARGRTLKII
jgi:LuxR family maltose regulon positive regulatory protein